MTRPNSGPNSGPNLGPNLGPHSGPDKGPIPGPATGPTLADQLARIATELDFSRDLLVEVEASAGALAAAAGSRAPATARVGLQAVDRLDQRLAGLSQWLQVLAGDTPERELGPNVIASLQNVPLGELRSALGPLSPPRNTLTPSASNAASPGSMEVF